MTTTCCKCNQPIEILNPIAQALVDQGFLIQCQSCMRGILVGEKVQEPKTRYPWEDAPPEAAAAATDSDGKAYWHCRVPSLAVSMWCNGTLHAIHGTFPTDDWQNSLEMRPTK